MADIEKAQRIDSLFERISSLIEQARGYVVNSMKIAEVKTRYEVGRYIYEDEQQGERAAYGEQMLKNLSTRLTERFGADWSYDTLKRCRQFYQAYLHAQIGATPLHQFEEGEQTAENNYDRHVRQEFENPTIGILLCGEKSDALVELTLPENSNIYASQYSLYLPDKALLQRKLKEWIEEFNDNQ